MVNYSFGSGFGCCITWGLVHGKHCANKHLVQIIVILILILTLQG